MLSSELGTMCQALSTKNGEMQPLKRGNPSSARVLCFGPSGGDRMGVGGAALAAAAPPPAGWLRPPHKSNAPLSGSFIVSAATIASLLDKQTLPALPCRCMQSGISREQRSGMESSGAAAATAAACAPSLVHLCNVAAQTAVAALMFWLA